MSDIYDEAVAPEKILEAWSSPSAYRGGILFRFVGDGPDCGCLCMIAHSDDFETPNKKLTASIRRDKRRIPGSGNSITPADLPVFAEWNRRIDKELNRPVPTTIGG